MHPIHLLIAAAAPAAAPVERLEESIVVTAAREPVERDAAPASTTLIGGETLELLGFPLAADVLRLMPGVAVATSGPPGSQTQIRIRGAEANHSLLFVDGIRFNDPAAANEARFELLTNDALSRIELVRGPQSALWGSEAIGGVVAVETSDPRRAREIRGIGEYGSLDSARASARLSLNSGPFGVSGGAGWLRSDGIDAFGARGERDGFVNRSADLKAVFAPSSSADFGVVGHLVDANSQFDGLDPVTFLRADTLDATDNRIAAGRVWGRIGPGGANGWKLSFGASLLDSSNRNRRGAAPLNRTAGRRATLDGQFSAGLDVGGTAHNLVLAAEHRAEDFAARDQEFFGATDQDRSRSLSAVVAQWRATWNGWLISDIALRQDSFSDFADATTIKAGLIVLLDPRWSLHAAYGEGIAQPSFYDLFGFFPGSFVGNPDLRPESSQSWEAGLRWSDGRTSIGVTGFTARLEDEIVSVFDPDTFLSSAENASGKSGRRGVEVDARRELPGGGAIMASYSLLDADERQPAARVREIRRPKHSASLSAAMPLGPVGLGASLAYVGERSDTDFESFPARTVYLDAYVLASLSLAWRIDRRFELYGRMENGFGADYEDAFGYATPGRTVHAGLRLHFGD